MGLYARVPNVTQGGRPVYRNFKANYLYFWPANGTWGIGPDYASDPIGARSSGSAPALCPHLATGWQVVFNGQWVRPSSASSDLAFVGADAWRRCVRSGWRCVCRFVMAGDCRCIAYRLVSSSDLGDARTDSSQSAIESSPPPPRTYTCRTHPPAPAYARKSRRAAGSDHDHFLPADAARLKKGTA
jgi:hypothetical protein